METPLGFIRYPVPQPIYPHQRDAKREGYALSQKAYLIWLSEIRVPSSKRTLIHDTSISTLVCACATKEGMFHIPSQIKKILKNLCGLGIQFEF